jgi:hypothetical protein
MQPTPPRWTALRTYSNVLRIFAWIIAVIGGLFVLGTLCTGLVGLANSGSSSFGGVAAGAAGGSLIVTAVISAIAFGLAFLGAMAAAELIMLFIAVEENTRIAAQGAHPVAAPMYAVPAPASVPMPPPPYNPGYPPTYPPTTPGGPSMPYQPPQG